MTIIRNKKEGILGQCWPQSIARKVLWFSPMHSYITGPALHVKLDRSASDLGLHRKWVEETL